MGMEWVSAKNCQPDLVCSGITNGLQDVRGEHGDGLGITLWLHWKEKVLRVFCLNESSDKAGVLCWHLLQLTRLVRLGVKNGVNSFVKHSHSLAGAQGAFPAPPITVLITRDYQVPQNRPQASFCMQTGNDFLVHAGKALFRVSSVWIDITHHCQLSLNNAKLKYCCARTAHACQKANIMLSELPV